MFITISQRKTSSKHQGCTKKKKNHPRFWPQSAHLQHRKQDELSLLSFHLIRPQQMQINILKLLSREQETEGKRDL